MFVNERGRILRNASRNSYKGFAKGFCGLGRLLASLNREEASNRVGTRLEWKLLPFLGRKRKMDFTTRLDRIYIFRRATVHFHEKRIKGNFPISLTQGQLE